MCSPWRFLNKIFFSSKQREWEACSSDAVAETNVVITDMVDKHLLLARKNNLNVSLWY